MRSQHRTQRRNRREVLLGLLAGAAPCADAVQNVFGADLLHRDQRQRLAPPALAWLAERSAARSEGPRLICVQTSARSAWSRRV